MTVPGSSANESSSTAVSLPKRLVSDSATTTGATAHTLPGVHLPDLSRIACGVGAEARASGG